MGWLGGGWTHGVLGCAGALEHAGYMLFVSDEGLVDFAEEEGAHVTFLVVPVQFSVLPQHFGDAFVLLGEEFGDGVQLVFDVS